MKTTPPSKAFADLTLSSFLRHLGHKLVAIQRDGNRAVFVFAVTPALEADVLRFYNGEGSVEPLSFSELVRSLKAAAMAQAGGR
ncbi:MAG TPA: hypothetical protein VGT06_04900 [Candidatus Methylomirabilis sp.]|jgi:hypothetical protein|nr:hypothetical protein [Candidatus Methylomirabilis sp.]